MNVHCEKRKPHPALNIAEVFLEVKAMKSLLRRKPFKDDCTGNIKAPLSSGLRHARFICDKRARFSSSLTAPRLQAVPRLSPGSSEPYVLETSLWSRHDELMHCSASPAFRAVCQREAVARGRQCDTPCEHAEQSRTGEAMTWRNTPRPLAKVAQSDINLSEVLLCLPKALWRWWWWGGGDGSAWM